MRTLPHAPQALYGLVSDVDAYRHYLPYCLGSRVTARSPTNDSPTEAELRVGWGSFDETFLSKVRCLPDALSVEADASHNPLFERLIARWEIVPGARGGAPRASDVRLHVEFQFVNPLYAAVSGAIAPKVARKNASL